MRAQPKLIRARASHFSSYLSVGQSSLVTVRLNAFNMGNILQRNAPTDGAFATPKIPTLSSEEVQIIKSSWKIPSANVSEEVCIYEHSIVTGRCLLSHS